MRIMVANLYQYCILYRIEVRRLPMIMPVYITQKKMCCFVTGCTLHNRKCVVLLLVVHYTMGNVLFCYWFLLNVVNYDLQPSIFKTLADTVKTFAYSAASHNVWNLKPRSVQIIAKVTMFRNGNKLRSQKSFCIK